MTLLLCNPRLEIKEIRNESKSQKNKHIIAYYVHEIAGLCCHFMHLVYQPTTSFNQLAETQELNSPTSPNVNNFRG